MDHESFVKLGVYLKQKRIQSKLSQIEVAKKLGYTSQFIANWERGVSSPPMSALKKIVEIYNINQKEFFEIMDSIQKNFWKRNIFNKKPTSK